VSADVGTPEQDAAYEAWVEDEGRQWVVFLAYYSRRPKALFAMNHRDAMAFCSDERTRGRNWMACHARIEGWQDKGKVPAKYRMKDTGKLDHVIEELGLTKIPI
jgi:hypothetical protein